MSVHISEVIEKCKGDMRSFDVAKAQRGITILPRNATQFQLSNHCNRLPVSNYKPVGEDNKISLTSMSVLYSKLSAYYDAKLGYAFPSKETLMDLTGLKEKTLRVAIRGLRDAGLIGLLPGYKEGLTSHYFFLMHSGSRLAFEVAVQKLAFENDMEFEISMGTESDVPF